LGTTERAMQRFNASSSLTKGYLICFTGTVFWSSTAIFISYLNNTYHLPSLVLAFWRDFFVVVALGAFFAITNRGRLRVERRHLKFFVLYGFVLSMFNASWTLSVGLNGAAVSTVLAYSSAAFTALLGWQLFSERLGPAKILAVSLSLVGCAFVSGAFIPSAWQVNPLGIITGLFSGLAFAAYSLMGKGAAQRKIDPWSTLLYTFGFGTLFLLAYNLIPGWLPSPRPVPGLFWLGGAFLGWVVLIILAIGPTIAGYGLYTVSMNYLPASVANLIATLEPVMTAILAYLLLGERMTPPQLFGGAMILGGVVLLRLSEGRAPSSPQETVVM
jgi:drug/metabolite transporter (DMT)-like permease